MRGLRFERLRDGLIFPEVSRKQLLTLYLFMVLWPMFEFVCGAHLEACRDEKGKNSLPKYMRLPGYSQPKFKDRPMLWGLSGTCEWCMKLSLAR